MQKALTEMNLQLHEVIADITGVTGLRIIPAILTGESNPAMLARLCDSGCHANAETNEKVLTSNCRQDRICHLDPGGDSVGCVCMRASLAHTNRNFHHS